MLLACSKKQGEGGHRPHCQARNGPLQLSRLRPQAEAVCARTKSLLARQKRKWNLFEVGPHKVWLSLSPITLSSFTPHLKVHRKYKIKCARVRVSLSSQTCVQVCLRLNVPVMHVHVHKSLCTNTARKFLYLACTLSEGPRSRKINPPRIERIERIEPVCGLKLISN